MDKDANIKKLCQDLDNHWTDWVNLHMGHRVGLGYLISKLNSIDGLVLDA